MHRLILILFCLLLAVEGSAAPPQYAFRITFTDKQGSPALSANPAWLSARSLARRANFGIALDSTDRPVSPRYIDSVLRLNGAVLHNTSRWLNHCVILLEDSSRILQLSGKPYISDIAWIGYFGSGLHQRVAKAENPKFGLELGAQSLAKVTGSPLYYGSSYTQTSFVNGDYLHDQGFRGEGKLIAVLDEGFTGVDTHSGFDSLRQQGRLLETYNFRINSPNVFTSGAHGTGCMSTIGGYLPGTYVGSAPKAQFALYATEDGSFTDAIYELDNLIAAIERADSIGADVISASVVYNIFISPLSYAFTKPELDGHTTIVARAVNMAVAKGIFYTSSAGNEGGNFWNYLDSPGDADSALTIGSVNTLRAPSSFSSPGPSASGRIKPDVCLLGEPATIFGGSNNIFNSSGTSYAAPQAAGYAACLMQAFPKATPCQIREAIIRSADSFASPSARRGYGVPNFRNVYQALSVESPAGADLLEVRPNPFWTSFMVKLPAAASVADISVTDISGRKVVHSAHRDGSLLTIDMDPSLPDGLYLLIAVIDGKRQVVKLSHHY
jgi:subtilisin family serine protease